MKKYLLDTNICIYYIKGLFDLDNKIDLAGEENCFISEITLAEFKFGVANSKNRKSNQTVLQNFTKGINVMPILNSLDIYAEEKTRLRVKGEIIDEFDLLIGATAIANNFVLVTNNTKHFKRLQNITIEDWTKE